MANHAATQAFTAALEGLVAEIKDDRSILAAILCGSLSHDTVWARSDIDLALVTIDDRKLEGGSIALNADGLNVHAFLITRSHFRRTVESALQNSFVHSLLSKGRLLYTHDETIGRLCESLKQLGRRDREVQLVGAAAHALSAIYKAHKWMVTRRDLDYTALWLLYAATPLAQIEVISAGLVAGREVIPQASELNPTFFKTIYTDLLNEPKREAVVVSALAAVDRYIEERTSSLFAVVFDYLREAGEARSCSEIERHFERHFDIGQVVTVCEYLADRGLIGKVSSPARLTPKSNREVQELAFVYLGA
jgi:hypothetical protein